MKAYIFTSKRLGFREWTEADSNKMAAINSDNDVMEFFPEKQNYKQTLDFI